MVASYHYLCQLANNVTAKVRVRPIAHDVSKAHNPVHGLAFEVLDYRLQGLQVAVDIR
jgi:hypothetical protein